MCNCNEPSNCGCDCTSINLDSCLGFSCDEKTDAACVIYKKDGREESELNCIAEIPSNTSIEHILEMWDRELCERNVAAQDKRVSVDGTDDSDYLYNKVVVGDCLSKSIDSLGRLKVDLDINCICSRLTSIGCRGGDAPCAPISLKPNLTATSLTYCGQESVTLSVTNDNGDLSWYRDGVLIPNHTARTLIISGIEGIYFVKNTTACDNLNSDPISIVYSANCNCVPQATTPIVTPSSGIVNQNESILLTANHCNGNVTWWSGNSQVATGTTAFLGAGTYYAKCTRPCNSVNSEYVTVVNVPICPTVSGTVTATSPTCVGETLLTNGEIVVSDIIEATQISINGENYVPINHLGGGEDTHKFFNLTAGAYTIRLKSSNSSCPAVVYPVTIISTNCQCLPISANTPTVQSPTCTNNLPNQNGSITITGLENVNKISINTVCGNNSWENAQTVTNNTHTFSNLGVGTYYIKYYTSNTCFSTTCITATVTSVCCQLTLSNPQIIC